MKFFVQNWEWILGLAGLVITALGVFLPLRAMKKGRAPEGCAQNSSGVSVASVGRDQHIHQSINVDVRAILDGVDRLLRERGAHQDAALAASLQSIANKLEELAACTTGESAVTSTDQGSRQPPELSRTTLARLYGLTPTEARVACGIAAGKSLEEAAQMLGLTTGATRVHLKHVFTKTQTGRQAELVHTLLTGPATTS